MKNVIKFLSVFAIIAVIFTSCSRDDNNNNNNNNNNTVGSGEVGNWILSSWDGSSSVATGSLNLKADGTFDFQHTWSGSSTAKTETGTYVKNNSIITFTKTGGDIDYMSWKEWTIDVLDANNLKMTRNGGLKAEFTK